MHTGGFFSAKRLLPREGAFLKSPVCMKSYSIRIFIHTAHKVLYGSITVYHMLLCADFAVAVLCYNL